MSGNVVAVKFWNKQYYISGDDMVGIDFKGNYYLLGRHNEKSAKTDIGIKIPKTRVKEWVSKGILWEKSTSGWSKYCKTVYKVNILKL